MLFSIIIPTCNRNNLLSLCLDRLAPGFQTMDASLYEVIVSDDGKNNEARLLMETKYPWAQWIEGPKRGPASNRNYGAKLAKGDWLVFTDDDCLPDINWLQAYIETIKLQPGCKAFEGAVIPDDWNLLKKDMSECPVNTTGGCFWSANIIVGKKLFDEVGGFDEQYKIAAQEDQDLKIQILKKTNIFFAKSASVTHPVRIITFKKALKSSDQKVTNFLYYARKNADELNFKNIKDIIWKGGILTQLKATINHFSKFRISSGILCIWTLLTGYIPKYLNLIKPG